jgi:hypothetical protein
MPLGKVMRRNTETGDPARLPTQLAGRWELYKVKKYALRKIIFCTGLTRAAKAGQKSIVLSRRAQGTNQEPFHLYSLSPHSPQSQESAGGPHLSILSG